MAMCQAESTGSGSGNLRGSPEENESEKNHYQKWIVYTMLASIVLFMVIIIVSNIYHGLTAVWWIVRWPGEEYKPDSPFAVDILWETFFSFVVVFILTPLLIVCFVGRLFFFALKVLYLQLSENDRTVNYNHRIISVTGDCSGECARVASVGPVWLLVGVFYIPAMIVYGICAGLVCIYIPSASGLPLYQVPPVRDRRNRAAQTAANAEIDELAASLLGEDERPPPRLGLIPGVNGHDGPAAGKKKAWRDEDFGVKPSASPLPVATIEGSWEGKKPAAKSVSRRECVVCLDRSVNTVFVPCGHTACCVKCAAQLDRCPVCRAASSHMRTFSA